MEKNYIQHSLYEIIFYKNELYLLGLLVFSECYGLDVCPLQVPNSYVEILTPNVMVLGGEALGR